MTIVLLDEFYLLFNVPCRLTNNVITEMEETRSESIEFFRWYVGWIYRTSVQFIHRIIPTT